MDLSELRQKLEQYEFYHAIELAPGLVTQGWQPAVGLQLPVLMEIQARELTGKRVLDIGCRDGLFSFAAEQQGAEFVLGIDNNLSTGAVEVLIPWFKSKVEMREVNLYEFRAGKKRTV